MIDDSIRKILPYCVRPVLLFYRRYNIHPNTLSLCGFVGAMLSAFCVYLHWPCFALALWWLGRLCDGTDGIWARESQQASAFGAYWDIVLDMAAYSVMIIAFALIYPELYFSFMFILMLYVLCITSALALGMGEQSLGINPKDNRGIRLGAGLAEGGETGIAYSIFILLPHYISYSVRLWMLVLMITILFRTFLAKKVLSK